MEPAPRGGGISFDFLREAIGIRGKKGERDVPLSGKKFVFPPKSIILKKQIA